MMIRFWAVDVVDRERQDGQGNQGNAAANQLGPAAARNSIVHQIFPNRPRGQDHEHGEVDGEHADLFQTGLEHQGGDGLDLADDDAGQQGAGDGAEAAEGDGDVGDDGGSWRRQWATRSRTR